MLSLNPRGKRPTGQQNHKAREKDPMRDTTSSTALVGHLAQAPGSNQSMRAIMVTQHIVHRIGSRPDRLGKMMGVIPMLPLLATLQVTTIGSKDGVAQLPSNRPKVGKNGEQQSMQLFRELVYIYIFVFGQTFRYRVPWRLAP